MSTFGKKALNRWDYYPPNSKDEFLRYNNSPKDIQLQILQRWYPIGVKCNKLNRNYANNTYSKSGIDIPQLVIISHVEHETFWHAGIVYIDSVMYQTFLSNQSLNKNNLYSGIEYSMAKLSQLDLIKHPLSLEIDESFVKQQFRDYQISKLLR